MNDYSIELFELYDGEELIDFAASDDSSNTIQLSGGGDYFESEAYHAAEWAESHGLKVVQTTVSLSRLKAFLNSNK